MPGHRHFDFAGNSPPTVLLHGKAVPQVTELKYLGVWVDSQFRWDHHIRECCKGCLDRLKLIHRLCATYWGLHPRVVSVLIRATIFPKLFYGVSAWGGVVRFLARLVPIDRALRQAAILTLGLLRTTPLLFAGVSLLTWRFATPWSGLSCAKQHLASRIYCTQTTS